MQPAASALPWVSTATESATPPGMEGLLPEQGPVASELRHREVKVPVFAVVPAASTLPLVSTATDVAESRPLAVPFRVRCQSRVPSPANFATMKSTPAPVFEMRPAASTLPSVSTATDGARVTTKLAVPLRFFCQSRVPSPANFATVKSSEVPVFVGAAGGERVALGIHRHREPHVSRVGRAIEGLLPEQRSIAGEFRHGEVLRRARIRAVAGGQHVALGIHRHRERDVSRVGRAVEGPLPEQGPVAGELRHGEVPTRCRY